MGKKPFTTRIDDKVLEVAQRLADAERRSVTSLIEVAVLEYDKRGVVQAEAHPMAPAVTSVIPALVAFYRENQPAEEDANSDLVLEVAEAVGGAIVAMNVLYADAVPEAVASAFGGRGYVEAIFAWRKARGEYKTKRGKGKSEPPAPPPLPL
jgi:hypothetical protein